MKASELVKVLQKAIDEFGDLPVYGIEGDCDDPYELEIDELQPVPPNKLAQEKYRYPEYFKIS